MTQSENGVFETPRLMRRDRLLPIVLWTVLALAFPILGGALGAAAADALGYGKLAAPAGLVAAVGVLSLCIRLGVRAVRNRSRYRMVLREDDVELGHGWTFMRLPYADVRMIRVVPVNITKQVHWVELVAPRDRGRVVLAGENVATCAGLLVERCPNAVYFDKDGDEHLPRDTTRPEQVLHTLVTHYRRLFWGGLAVTVLLGIPVITAVIELIADVRKGKTGFSRGHGLIAVLFIDAGIAASTFVSARKLRKARKALAAVQARNGGSSGPVGGPPPSGEQ